MKLILLVTLLSTQVLLAKDTLVNCRFLCFEHAKDDATTLVAAGDSKSLETIPLTLKKISKPFALKSVNGEIAFKKSVSDTALAATAKVPAGAKDAIIVFLPSTNEALIYDTLVLDSSSKAFKKGSSIVLNIGPGNAKASIGENQVEIASNESATLARPKTLDQFNMANVRFQMEMGGSWRNAFESTVRILENQHHLFVIYLDPASKRPNTWRHTE